MTGDYLAAVIAMISFNIVRFYLFVEDYFSSLMAFLLSKPVIAGTLMIPAVLLAIYALSGFYVNTWHRSRVDVFINTLVNSLIGALLIYFALIVNDSVRDRGTIYELISVIWSILFLSTYLFRRLVAAFILHHFYKDNIGETTLIVGTSETARQMACRLGKHTRPDAFNVVGFVDIDSNAEKEIDARPVYPLDKLAEVCQNLRVKRLVALPHPDGVNATLSLINSLYPIGCEIYISPILFHVISGKSSLGSLRDEALVNISAPDLPAMTIAVKRAFDVAVSVIALLIMSPFMAAIAIAIKRDSKGPVFYKQPRLGLHKREFNIIKFRSMATDAEKEGPALSSATDKRVTHTGRFLRKYRLDELPQFWNVIRGDMSIVGPRPERKFYVDRIAEKSPRYTLIHTVRPGITSWGMVKYGYASTIEQMVERMKYDLLYIENISIGTDLKILAYTFKTVFTGRGV